MYMSCINIIMLYSQLQRAGVCADSHGDVSTNALGGINK